MAETPARRTASKRSTSERSTSERSAPQRSAAKTVAEQTCSVAFCPIGRAMNATAGVAPEVLSHLMNAAREFLLAAMAVMDAKPGCETHGAKAKLEKIEIG